jgi:hypothetical protein
MDAIDRLTWTPLTPTFESFRHYNLLAGFVAKSG